MLSHNARLLRDLELIDSGDETLSDGQHGADTIVDDDTTDITGGPFAIPTDTIVLESSRIFASSMSTYSIASSTSTQILATSSELEYSSEIGLTSEIEDPSSDEENVQQAAMSDTDVSLDDTSEDEDSDEELRSELSPRNSNDSYSILPARDIEEYIQGERCNLCNHLLPAGNYDPFTHIAFVCPAADKETKRTFESLLADNFRALSEDEKADILQTSQLPLGMSLLFSTLENTTRSQSSPVNDVAFQTCYPQAAAYFNQTIRSLFLENDSGVSDKFKSYITVSCKLWTPPFSASDLFAVSISSVDKGEFPYAYFLADAIDSESIEKAMVRTCVSLESDGFNVVGLGAIGSLNIKEGQKSLTLNHGQVVNVQSFATFLYGCWKDITRSRTLQYVLEAVESAVDFAHSEESGSLNSLNLKFTHKHDRNIQSVLFSATRVLQQYPRIKAALEMFIEDEEGGKAIEWERTFLFDDFDKQLMLLVVIMSYLEEAIVKADTCKLGLSDCFILLVKLCIRIEKVFDFASSQDTSEKLSIFLTKSRDEVIHALKKAFFGWCQQDKVLLTASLDIRYPVELRKEYYLQTLNDLTLFCQVLSISKRDLDTDADDVVKQYDELKASGVFMPVSMGARLSLWSQLSLSTEFSEIYKVAGRLMSIVANPMSPDTHAINANGVAIEDYTALAFVKTRALHSVLVPSSDEYSPVTSQLYRMESIQNELMSLVGMSFFETAADNMLLDEFYSERELGVLSNRGHQSIPTTNIPRNPVHDSTQLFINKAEFGGKVSRITDILLRVLKPKTVEYFRNIADNRDANAAFEVFRSKFSN